jgi:hypothetical protein
MITNKQSDMKKLKVRIRKWILHPWIRRHKAECTVVLKDAIVYQMWAAGISFPTINQWLSKMKQPTIKAYTLNHKKEPRIFYKILTSEERTEITTRIVNIV